MTLIDKSISDKVIAQLESIGIDSKVNGDDSHTANMIKIIVREIVLALKRDAEVIVQVTTPAGPGTGKGKIF
jgi:hypothetical protein